MRKFAQFRINRARRIKDVSYVPVANILCENYVLPGASGASSTLLPGFIENFLAEDGAHPTERQKCALRDENEVTYRLRTKTRLIYK